MLPEFEIRCRNHLEQGDIWAAFNSLIDGERYNLQLEDRDLSYGSGYLPKVTYSGTNWLEHAREIASTKAIVNILEIGAGDDCAAWTGGFRAIVNQ